MGKDASFKYHSSLNILECISHRERLLEKVIIILLLLSKKLMILKKVVTEGPVYEVPEGIQQGKVKHPRVSYRGRPLPPLSRLEEID